MTGSLTQVVRARFRPVGRSQFATDRDGRQLVIAVTHEIR